MFKLDEDDQCYTDAFDVLLNTWTSLIETMGLSEIAAFIAPRAVFIVQSYISCHLAAPVGCRVKDENGL